MTLVDLQVNGYKGVNFSDAELTESDFIAACEGLVGAGTGVFLPTLVTSTMEVYERNLKLISQSVRRARIEKIIPGVHLEGPFISPAPGAVGAHNPSFVQKPSSKILGKLFKWSHDTVRLVTAAPEESGSSELIRACVENGVIAALGHTCAADDDIRRAADDGATLFTHLGNGIPNMLPRHPNTIWSALAEDRLSVSLITDGHHLPIEFIKAVVKAKGYERTIVVSDGTHVSGMPPGRYPGFDGDILLEPDGKLHDPARGCLAGSSAVMADCVRFLTDTGIMDSESVDLVCRRNPTALLSPA